MDAVVQQFSGDRQGLMSSRSRRTEPEAFALGEVRRARDVTQVELAGRLDVAQATVSKFEKSNPGVSTLRRYVEALGGQLQLVAVFDDDRMLLDCGLGRAVGGPRSARG